MEIDKNTPQLIDANVLRELTESKERSRVVMTKSLLNKIYDKIYG